MKDKSEPHFSLPFTVGGCDRAFLEDCLRDYEVVASYKYNKDGQLQPDLIMKYVTAYVLRHLSPLDIHPIQAVRLMLLEKYFQLGEKWCKPGAQLQFFWLLLAFFGLLTASFFKLALFCKLAHCLARDNSVIPSFCRLRRVLGLFQAFSLPLYSTNTA
jgi:hypothetical protein